MIKSSDKDIMNESDPDLVYILLFGSSKYEYHIDPKVLNFSIDFIIKTERFSGQLFWELDNVNNGNLWIQFLIISLLNFDLVNCIYFYILVIIFTLPCYRYKQGLVLSAVL